MSTVSLGLHPSHFDSHEASRILTLGVDKALTQYMTINQAPRPSQRDVKDLRSWLGRPSMGNSFLVGIEAQVWDDKNMTDFINPAVKKVDRFSALLTGPVLSGYHWLYGHKKQVDVSIFRHHNPILFPIPAQDDQTNTYSQKQETNPYDIGENLRVYDEKGIYLFADVLAVVLSSLLPTLMILGLYFIQSMLWRIGCVIIFTAIFGATLTVFTNARKIEIYSATAAFAAVEVVFIGSTAGAV